MTDETYEDVLAAWAKKNDDLIVMTAENRAAIRNLPLLLGPRFLDVGIAEQTMIGAAAGLALRGRLPVCHALATFLTLRAFEFIRTDVGIPNLPVKLVGGVPGVLSEANGPTHQAIEDVALMRTIPNMMVFCPSDARELAAGMRVLMDVRAPCYIRHNPRPLDVSHTPFVVGKAEELSEGRDVSILTYGFLVREALVAARELGARGIGARVVNMRMLKPHDGEAVVRAARETKLVVTLEDHFLTGGLYSIVAETLASRQVAARLLPIAFHERWFRAGMLEDVLAAEGLTGSQVARTIASTLECDAASSRQFC